MRLLLDPITSEIPKTPYWCDSISLNTSHDRAFPLMMDKETIDNYLKTNQKTRYDLETLNSQPMSLAFILEKKLSESQQQTIDLVLDTVLLQLDQQLDGAVSEEEFYSHWRKLSLLDRGIEGVILRYTRNLERTQMGLPLREDIEDSIEYLNAKIPLIRNQALFERLVGQLYTLTEELLTYPSAEFVISDADHLANDENILNQIMMDGDLPINTDPCFTHLDYEQKRCLCKSILDNLRDRGWNLSDDYQGLLYSHYNQRYNEQTMLYDNYKSYLVLNCNYENHTLAFNEFKHPYDNQSYINNYEPCDTFRDLLIACAINGDIAAVKRRRDILKADTGGCLTETDKSELNFFESIDAFLSGKEDYYLTYIENLYQHFIHDRPAVVELAETYSDSQVTILSDMLRDISPVSNERPKFKFFYNKFESDTDTDEDKDDSDYLGASESKSPR